MPLPRPLQPLVQTRRFWTDFLWETEAKGNAYPELEGCTITLPVGGGYGLSLSLDEVFCTFSLGFTSPSQETVEIAWDDQAHWHPHVLRWHELELICCAIAIQDAELPHPGIVLLLLHRFTPICEGDDLDLIVPMLDSAWRQLGVFTTKEIVAFIERVDARDAGFRWRRNDSVGGWCLEQEDRGAARSLYTLRHAESHTFPFGPWAQMLEAAQHVIARAKRAACVEARAFANTGDMALVPEIIRSLRSEDQARLADSLGEQPPPARVCWIVETLLGLDPGMVLKRYVPRMYEPREKHSLSLLLPLDDSKRPLPAAAGGLIANSLHGVLSDCDLGEARVSGSTSTRANDGTYVTTQEDIFIHIKGDLKRGIDLARDMLWWVRAPESVRLRRWGGGDILLELVRKPHETGEICVQLTKLRTVHWENSGARRYRFDRLPLSHSCRTALKSVLANARAKGPDDDGWFIAELPDGGSVQICLRRLDDDPDLDAGTVVLRRLTPEAAQLVHRLMSVGHLILLPLAITSSTTEAQTVTVPWPHVRVVESPLELYDILTRGPYEWWSNQRGEADRQETS